MVNGVDAVYINRCSSVVLLQYDGIYLHMYPVWDFCYQYSRINNGTVSWCDPRIIIKMPNMDGGEINVF